MNKIAVVYHSAHGHTEFIARQVADGVTTEDYARVAVRKAEDLIAHPSELTTYDGLILGSPTYLGGVSGTLKTLMDATGGLWRSQQLRGKLAAGFTVSSLPSGDKQSTLQSMFTFCMQHGMIWVGNPILPEQHSGVPDDEAANRLGSWTGLMAQARHGAPADAFPPGDSKGARLFGAHFARTLARLGTSEPVASGSPA
ncbi:flavodoxin family protein [Hydrocarboniphaga effusa]|jgi:NAD(P)H dehydrogenase (quinone)|uniref:flavodoxin family protein n=1 Tax=Hydrocarboniphaga effusa TaxID=243629 RepID=UPI0035AD9769